MPYIGNDPVPLIYGLLDAVSEHIDATSTTVVDGDRLVLRDESAAATTKMRQIIVEDLAAYLDDKITAMPNLVSVGALNVGSITSGFTSIDVGAGAITTTGIITGGTLEATTDTASGDNAAIGYTSVEGLILTGQGSTNDVTIKNDADADVLKIPTGTTNVDVVGNLGVGGNLTVTGTTAFNGGTITLGDAAADNVVFGADVNSSIIPNGAGGSFDLGSSGQEWRDLFINGTAHIDTLDVDENATVAGTLGVTGIATFTDDIIIGDGKTIGSASDVDAITIASNGQVTLTQTLIGTALDISGDIDVDGTTNLDIVDIDGAVDMATTLAVAGNVDFNGDLDVDGTTNLDVVDIDGAVNIAAATTIDTTNKIQFRDTGLYINSSTDGQLDIVADTEIQIAATTVDLNGNLDVSGTVVAVGNITTSGTVEPAGDTAAGDNAAIGYTSVDGLIITGQGSTNDVTIKNDADAIVMRVPTGTDDVVFTDNVTISGDLTVTGTTTQVDTVTMEAANAVVFEGATADDHETTLTIVDPTADRTINLPNQSGTVPVLAAASNTQVTSTPEELNKLDGVTATTAQINNATLTTSTTAELNILDGATVVVGEVNALDLGSTAIGTAIASKAVVLDANKDYTGLRNFTVTGELDAATGDFSSDVDIDGDLLVGDDLTLDSDAAVLGFGADTDVTLTHVADTGILLNAAMVVQFRDSAINIGSPADGDLDINADDEIELNSTLIDINGNVEISGTTAQVGVATSTAKDIFNAGMSLKNGATSAGFIEFFEDSDNGTNKVTLVGPASTADITLTLPSVAGTIATTTSAADDATALAIALG